MTLSKGFYLGSVVGGFGLAILLLIIGVIAAAASGGSRSGAEGALSIIFLAYVPMLYGAVVVCVLIYKMWSAIQDGYARATPGKALGFCFIPFFNFYWAFQVYWGWAKDYNAYIRRHNINVTPLPEGLFLTVCILILTAWIPFLGALAALVNVVLMMIMISKICDAVNAIAGKVTAAPAPASGFAAS